MEAAAEESEVFARASEAWREGRHQAATQLLQAVVEKHPQHVTALNTLAMIALNGGDSAGAVHWLERAVAVEPGAAPTGLVATTGARAGRATGKTVEREALKL